MEAANSAAARLNQNQTLEIISADHHHLPLCDTECSTYCVKLHKDYISHSIAARCMLQAPQLTTFDTVPKKRTPKTGVGYI